MQKNNIKLSCENFLSYLKQPISFEDLDEPRNVLYHDSFKKFKNSCKNDETAIIETMKYVAKNISTLDNFKVFVASNVFLELLNYKNPSILIIKFSIGMLIRCLMLTERYLLKVLNYVENSTIMSNAPSEIKAWKSMNYVLEPALIVLSSSPLAREKLRENPNNKILIEKLKTYITSLNEISKLYSLTDNTSFTILHPKKLIGFNITATGVQNNYHLFTLIQHELLQKANNALKLNASMDDNAVSIAKGERKFDIDRKITVDGCFDFYSYKAYKGELTNPKFDLKYALAGESLSDLIPESQNKKIIIIDSPPKNPSDWDTHAFKPLNIYTTASANLIEVIPKDNVIDILKKMYQGDA